MPDAIKENGKIVVGTDPTYAPNEFLDTDGKTVIGFDVDLFNAVAGSSVLETEWVPSDFSDIIPGVGSGKYEIGVSSFTINSERLAVADMVSYFSAGTQWAAKKGNPSGIQPDDACGKKVAVQTGTVQETDDLPVRDQACTAAGKPAIVVELYQARDQATAAGCRARTMPSWPTHPSWLCSPADRWGAPNFRRHLRRGPVRLHVIEKDQADFGKALVDALTALIEDGTCHSRGTFDEWGVGDGAIDNPQGKPLCLSRIFDDDGDTHLRPAPPDAIKAVPVRHPEPLGRYRCLGSAHGDVRAHAAHQ